jgi:uncharacterized protein (TIGR03067 family)
MRRTVSFLAVLLLVVPLLGSDSPREYDDRTEDAAIEGTWQLLAVEHDGRTVNTFTWIYTLRGGDYTRTDSDGDRGTGTYHTDANQNPPRFDFCASKEGKYGAIKAIYQCQGDTLKMAWSRGDAYPKSFHDNDIWLGTFKRLK